MITRETAQKAARWWARQVCAPHFAAQTGAEVAAEANPGLALAEFIASMSVESVEEGVAALFIDILTKRIIEEQPSYLGVDYHPCQLLSVSGDKAGLPPHNWPWKTHMDFRYDGSVWVSTGYGATPEQL